MNKKIENKTGKIFCYVLVSLMGLVLIASSGFMGYTYYMNEEECVCKTNVTCSYPRETALSNETHLGVNEEVDCEGEDSCPVTIE